MKLKSIAKVAALVASGWFSSAAHAQPEAYCWLGLNLGYGVTEVPVGGTFSFSTVFVRLIDFSPPPPPDFPRFRVVFYGTRDGVNDLPNGFEHPGLVASGWQTLTGYGNPGGISGEYRRYALVYDVLSGATTPMCRTNEVAARLQ
jgi:hypothetical protein